MDSTDNPNNREKVFRADHHLHPYGEIIWWCRSMKVLRSAERLVLWRLDCARAWQPPLSGSEGGAVISLTFLPAGRIAFGVNP